MRVQRDSCSEFDVLDDRKRAGRDEDQRITRRTLAAACSVQQAARTGRAPLPTYPLGTVHHCTNAANVLARTHRTTTSPVATLTIFM